MSTRCTFLRVARVPWGCQRDVADGDKVFEAVPEMEERRDYLAAAKIPFEDSEDRRVDIDPGAAAERNRERDRHGRYAMRKSG